MQSGIPEIALISDGAFGHTSQHMSYSPMLAAILRACSVKIGAYGYTQATDPSNLDTEQNKNTEQRNAAKKHRMERRGVERERFQNTAYYFGFNYYNQWERILDREPNITALMMSCQDGENRERLEKIQQSELDIKQVLLMPPIATRLEDAQKIAAQASPTLTVWYPLRYARGIRDAMEIIHNSSDFGLVSYSFNFGCSSYTHLWTKAIPQYIDLLRVLFGEVEAFSVRVTGMTTQPTITMTTEHKSGVVGSVSIDAHRFMQNFAHAHFIITGHKNLVIIDDAALRRCSFYNTVGVSHVPSFTHDVSPMEPSIKLIDAWVDSWVNAHKNPIPIEDAVKTMYLVTALQEACETITTGTIIKADFQRSRDGTYHEIKENYGKERKKNHATRSASV